MIDETTSEENMRETEINALTEYFMGLAIKIAKNGDSFAYFHSKDVPHGEMHAQAETDIEELYRTYLLISRKTQEKK